MLPVFVNDEPPAGHNIEHVINHRARNKRPFARPAPLRIAPFVLRPQAMQNKRIPPSVASVALQVVIPSLGLRTMRRTPRQNERIIVEITGRVAARSRIKAGASKAMSVWKKSPTYVWTSL